MRKSEHDAIVRQYQNIITNIWWMARRYADNCSTYAPSMMNEATRSIIRLGMNVKPDPINNSIWAKDGMGRNFDHLSPEEATDGSDEAKGIHLGNKPERA